MADEAQDNAGKPVEPTSGEVHALWQESRLVFFTTVLFSALSGIFSALAFTFDDMQTATVLAFTGLLVFMGVICQMLAGLKPWLRLYYGFCGLGAFFFLILRGGIEHMGLFGALAITPGFVLVLGWRTGGVFLGLMLVATGIIFINDIYLSEKSAFPLLAELKFFVSFAGLALMSVGYGYSAETTFAQLIETNRKVSSLAYKDPLTGLPNRRAIEDLLGQRWEEYRRSGNTFAVLLCNIDNFKHINDQYGRDFGDGVLVRLANVLIRGVRSQDVVSRWGGDEFLIMLPGQTHFTGQRVAERIRRRVEDIELVMLGQPVPVTLSIGVAAVENALDARDIVSVADSGLYQAKNTGKNRVVMG